MTKHIGSVCIAGITCAIVSTPILIVKIIENEIPTKNEKPDIITNISNIYKKCLRNIPIDVRDICIFSAIMPSYYFLLVQLTNSINSIKYFAYVKPIRSMNYEDIVKANTLKTSNILVNIAYCSAIFLCTKYIHDKFEYDEIRDW